ncbi:hypothetical protein ACQEVB_00740 [Pseudonocardia sp. CA-107938]|uniref:hypothetical protein n=1 Tax=Pseudonocardia sp. CA-107938 TaxID=3240021 RepID=UPI003D93F39F
MTVTTTRPASRLTGLEIDLDTDAGAPTLPGVRRAEQDRVTARLRAHLERDPRARAAFLRDPEAVLRAAVPDAAPALLAAVAASRRSAPALPAGLALDRLPVTVGRPRPIRPVAQPAAAPATHPLGGFDACLAVGGDQLGSILADLLGPFLSEALADLGPTDGVGSLGLVDVVVAPTAAIDAVQGRVRLQVTAGVVLIVLGSDAPVPGLTVEITLDVAFGTTGTGTDREMVIDRASVEVTLLGLPLPLVPLLLDPVVELIADAVGGIFPRPFPFDLPGGSPDTCDIGMRDLAVALLAAQDDTQACLAVLTSLLADAEGDVAAVRSPLPADRTAGLFLDNVFLLRSIACEVQHAEQLAGLPAPTHEAQRTDPVPFVEWAGLSLEQEADGRTIVIHELKVAIDGADPLAKSFVVTAELTVVHPLFRADVSLRVPFTLRPQDGALHVDVGEVTHSVHVRLRLLGILLGGVLAIVAGVIAWLIGGVIAGGAVGVGVLAALIAALVIAVRRKIGAAITAATSKPIEPVQVIPRPLVELFGALAVDAVVLDDLEVYGTLVATPRRVRLVQQVLDHSSEQAGTTAAGTVFHLATTVRFRAVPTRLEAPVTYEWRIGGKLTGRPDLPAPVVGIAATTITGPTCVVRSVSGADVDTTVQVTATDRLGVTRTASAPLRLSGELVVPADELPGGKPDPRMPIEP